MTQLVGTILLVEDDEPQRKTLARFLEHLGYQVLEAHDAASANHVAEDESVTLLLTDLRLGGPDGIALLDDLKGNHPDLQALVMTAYGTVDEAVRAMKAGAYDFIPKPLDLEHLEALLQKASERFHLAQENRCLRKMVESGSTFDKLVGQSRPMQKVKQLAKKVSASRASLLLLGESGTGKEVLARAIHRASPRREKPFVTLNCAVLSETLIESELFGHEKGAFTGANNQKKGRFELAHTGTLFLDEVGDIPLALQVKLLNFLQSGEFERVGSTLTLSVDVRIIAATHRDLRRQIQEGTFREDLFYRLNVVSIRLPPLRERMEDIALLTQHFVDKHADLSNGQAIAVDPRVFDRLAQESFRGNVRQLENWVERAIVLSDQVQLTLGDFPFQRELDGQTARPILNSAGPFL